MIESIALQNFQSHKDTELLLHPGVNVLIGNSRAGKTSIIRALRWIIYNRPSGEAFRSHWGGDTTASIQIGDTQIHRIRNTNFNGYSIDLIDPKTSNEHTEQFEALGTTVPESIQKVLNITDLNFQQQLDSPFLLSMSPGKVAQYLNELVNLDLIDRSEAHVNKEIRERKRSITSVETELSHINLELEKFKDLNQWDEELCCLEKHDRNIEELINTCNNLEKLCDEIDITKQKTSKIQWIEPAKEEWQSIQKKIDSLKEKEHKRGLLRTCIQDIESCAESVNAYSKEIKRITNEWERIKPKTCPLCGQEWRNALVST